MNNYTEEQLANFSLDELQMFSENQLRVLSISDLKSDLRMQLASQAEDARIARFWREEYHVMTNYDKAKYWSGLLFRSMRSQVESGLNPYIIYSIDWLKETLILEPDFATLLPEIYKIWGGMFDSGKVDRIISRLSRENDSDRKI